MSDFESLAQLDSVYFFMFPGWKQELRSNRWHFARRFAQHKPVILIQPDLYSGDAFVEPEPRIKGASILHIRAPVGRDRFGERTVHDLATHMLSANHTRPLFWLYNPLLFPAYVSLPAMVRFYHASENYWDFDAPDPRLIDSMTRAMRVSDRVIAVSCGVADAVHEHVPGAAFWEISNGCDFAEYAHAQPSTQIGSDRAGFERVAVYAGNINGRIDFALLDRATTTYPTTLFVLAGPISGLSTEQTHAMATLHDRPNVRFYGPQAPEQLPSLYAAADVGLIPYTRAPLLERNGFPLKALEMAATGLPVVSTYMRPLEEIEHVIALTRSHDTFIAELGARSRATLSAEDRTALIGEAKKRDYDARFREILARWSKELPQRPVGVTALDALAAATPTREYLETVARFVEPCRVTLERCSRSFARSVAGRQRRFISKLLVVEGPK